MRVAIGLLATAVTLLVASAFSALGVWAVATGAVLMTVGAVWCAIALEAEGARATSSL